MNKKECVELLKNNNDFLIITHKNPDGDTVGSSAALCSALRRIGKTAYVYRNTQITDKLMPYVEPFFAEDGFVPGYVIAVDAATDGMLANGFEGSVQLCIDHHPSNSGYAENTFLCDERAACGEIVLDIIRALPGSITKDEATLLYIAVSTDTGCFQYSNTNAATLRAAAELLRSGADNVSVNTSFFRKVSAARIKLEGLVYSSLRFYRDGKISVATITLDMMAESGASEEDMDDIAGLANRVEGSVLGITIREKEDGTCRFSLRSTSEVNSSEICAVFGGGGHAMAAGCSITGSPEKARDMMLDVIDEVWK